MPAFKWTITVEGISRLKRLLMGDLKATETWLLALEEAADAVSDEARRRAPSDTGKLKASIHTRLGAKSLTAMNAKSVPMYAVVLAGATTTGGFRYPFVLEGGHRTAKKSGRIGLKTFRAQEAAGGRLIQLHYRGTNRSTAGWFRGALDALQGKLNGILNRAADKIESRWRSG